jgi:hypothetical protein
MLHFEFDSSIVSNFPRSRRNLVDLPQTHPSINPADSAVLSRCSGTYIQGWDLL